MSDIVEVQVGQLWLDNDPRNAAKGKRYVRVSEIDGARAICESWWDLPGSLSRTVRIRLSRLTSTGYTLVPDGEES